MEEKFIIGILFGMLGGALIAANSQKARECIRDGQSQVIEKVSELAEKGKKKSDK